MSKDEMKKECIFGVGSDLDFIHMIEKAVRDYEHGNSRSARDLFFIFLALNHLREWIAPTGKKKCEKKAKDLSAGEQFWQDIYNDSSSKFKTLNEVANGIKHIKDVKISTSTTSSQVMADWDTLAEVPSLAEGATTAHFVEGEPVKNIYGPCLAFYRERWFDKQGTN